MSAAEAQLLARGFRRWNSSGLLLIPLTLLSQVPATYVLTSIRGLRLAAARIDQDTRGGLLAWGVMPSEYEIAEGWFADG